MPEKPKKPDNPEQSKRFIETAEQVGAQDEKTLERAFTRISLGLSGKMKPPPGRSGKSSPAK
jgi:hypothetical protein